MSWPRILAMRHDDPDVLEGWLERLQADSVQRVGDLALTVNGGRFVETADGRAVGALRGLLFDDLEVAGWLDDRGHEVHADQHDRLAVDMVARFGPVGLARLRMQGVLACLLRGQGAVGMAGDAMGVGQLHFCRLQGGEVVASDHDLLNRLDGANRRAPALDDPARLWAGAATTHGETWRVPPGLLIVLGRGGVRFERLQRMETALPWLRHRPDWMQGADGSSVRGWLCGVLAEALAAAQRGVGPVVAGLATDRWQEAVCAMAKGHLHGAEHEDAARWSLSGIAGLFGDGSWPAQTPSTAPDARLRWLRTEHEVAMAGAPAWPEVELPEPTARTSVEQAAAVWLRHGWTLGQVIAAEQATAAELGTMPIWPQFDPAIVAGMGALSADALRAAF